MKSLSVTTQVKATGWYFRVEMFKKLSIICNAPFIRQTEVGQLVLANSNWCVNDTTTCWQNVGETLARIETSSICRQQFANMLLCRSHTPT